MIDLMRIDNNITGGCLTEDFGQHNYIADIPDKNQPRSHRDCFEQRIHQ